MQSSTAYCFFFKDDQHTEGRRGAKQAENEREVSERNNGKTISKDNITKHEITTF